MQDIIYPPHIDAILAQLAVRHAHLLVLALNVNQIIIYQAGHAF